MKQFFSKSSSVCILKFTIDHGSLKGDLNNFIFNGKLGFKLHALNDRNLL